MSRAKLVLIVLFVIATAVNIFKPFHIDDTYHLKAAQWILEEPLRPMSGMINWSGHLEPFHQGNHPPMFFYLMALWGLIFGFSEISMHLLLAVFTALSIHYFHRLARSIMPASALYLTALLVLGPAFLVNQNVMLEIPLLAMICAMLFHLDRFLRDLRTDDLVLAAIWLSAGILTKYTMIALVPVLFLAAWNAGRRSFWIALIPVLIVALWSWWNWMEFEGIHLLGRDPVRPWAAPIHVRILSWLLTFGAIAPWAVVALIGGLGTQVKKAIVWGLIVPAGLFIAFAWFGMIPLPVTDRVLLILFLLNGAAGISGLIFHHKELLPMRLDRQDMRWILLFSILCLASFIILFAPLMATRHVLLVLPMFLLLFSPIFQRITNSMRIATLTITTVLGVALSISDLRNARFYKEAATEIVGKSGNATVWFTGSLGWSWYAERAGMKDLLGQIPRSGDLIAIPYDIPAADPRESISTEQVEMIEQKLGPLDRFVTRSWLRFYAAGFPGTPWTVTTGSPDRIMLVRVE